MRAQLELLKNHNAESSAPGTPDLHDDSRDHGSRSSNGYEDLHLAAQNAARAIGLKTGAESHIHPDLRGHEDQNSPPSANMMSMPPQPEHSPVPVPGPPQAPLAPAPSSSAQDDGGEGHRAKRELSQSKRAAQNRAAQRAFRQRKEEYIKKLEQQVREFGDMDQSYKQVQSENYALREYVIHLQSRLLDTQGEFPPPPPNVNLSHPHGGASSHQARAESQPHHENPAAGTPLEAVAQAVAGLAAQEQMEDDRMQYTSTDPVKAEGNEEDTQTEEDIKRHLSEEGAGGDQ